MTATWWRTRGGLAAAGLRHVVAHPGATLRLGAAFQRNNRQLAAAALTRLGPTLANAAAVQIVHDLGVEEVVFTRNGVRWRTDIGDSIGRQLLTEGNFEGTQIAAVQRWMQTQGRVGTVIDLGANIGTTALPFAQAGHRVIAVEPVVATFNMLTENVTSNGFAARITCCRYAIGSAAGDVDIWLGHGSGQAELVVSGTDPAFLRWDTIAGRERVKSIRLDDLLRQLDVGAASVASVWSDVQGSETAVIDTGGDLWSAGVPLYLEVDPVGLDVHAGVEAHISAVEATFSRFLTRDDLLSGHTTGRAISGYGSWVAQIRAATFSDGCSCPRQEVTRVPHFDLHQTPTKHGWARRALGRRLPTQESRRRRSRQR